MLGECEGGEATGPRPEPRALWRLGTELRRNCMWFQHGGRVETWCHRIPKENVNGQGKVESKLIWSQKKCIRNKALYHWKGRAFP